jgi:ParB family transcriptional regulator, chromosome partitioning protein
MSRFRNDSIFWVEVEKIVPNPYQPRREFDPEKLKELSESIRMYGVLQPLTVSRKEVELENGGLRTEYELIAGERRLRASKLAGISQVPVLIREGEESEQEKLELAIIENLQREDLNAVDRALAFKQLAEQFNMPHSQVAKKVGRSREYVSNSIRLLNLPEVILEALKRAELNEGHARTLLMLNDRPEEQDTVFREILLKKLSVREVERIARKIATDKVRKKDWQGSDPALIAKEKEFTETLGTRVQIAKTDFGGKLTIDYFSEEDLDHLLGLLRTNQSIPKSAVAISAIAEEVEAPGTVDTAEETLEDATGLSFTDDTGTDILLSEDQTENVEPLLPAQEVEVTSTHAVQPENSQALVETNSVADVPESASQTLEQEAVHATPEQEQVADTEAATPIKQDESSAGNSLQDRVAARLKEEESEHQHPSSQQKKVDDDSNLYNLSNFSF